MSNETKLALAPTVGNIRPQTCAAAATKSTAWIDAGQAPSFIARGAVASVGGGSVALAFEQATSSGGAGAKTLAGGGSTTVDNTNVECDLEASSLDIANGFTHFRANMTTTGGGGSVLSAVVSATGPRYAS